MQKRLQALREGLARDGLRYLLVTGSHNRRYLSGFTGSTGVLLIGPDDAHVLTDFRYIEQVREQAPDFTLARVERTWIERLKMLVEELGIQEIAFESEHMTYQQYLVLAEALNGVALRPQKGLVERLREVKDENEISLMRQAVDVVDQAFSTLDSLRPGKPEREVAIELESRFRQGGASGPSFDTIVASGDRGALPHWVASEKVMLEGELVVTDCGCVLGGYCSDFTRTVCLGRKPEPWQQEIYEIVLEAQEAAIEAIKAGVACGDVDAAARAVISSHGYGDYFGHSTGHGVGLEIHEGPRLAPGNEQLLVAGNIVTVEPGIYLPGRGGVRIEDVVVVRDEGAEVLTRTPKGQLLLV